MLASYVCAQVREAMAALLVAVSRSRSVHFYEVVPLHSLLGVMAVDVPSVAACIQAILLPSYFPNPDEGAVSSLACGLSSLLPSLSTCSRCKSRSSEAPASGSKLVT